MIHIEPIPAFTDNYIWLLVDSDTSQAVVVDPGDAGPVEQALKEQNLQLEGILITHHHMDHIGGINQLLASHGHLPVYGPYSESIPQITHALGEGDNCNILGLNFTVIAVPGHTLDHIALFTDQTPEHPALFCGDTLFAGGCGRIFEGDPQMMYTSLLRLAKLPGDTRVFCAHEYTLANLAFAQAVEPDNRALQQRIADCQSKRQDSIPTVPSTIAEEHATNPFLRCHLPEVQQAATQKGYQSGDNWQVFATVRSWKDNF